MECSSLRFIKFLVLKPANPDIAVIADQPAPLKNCVVVVGEKLRCSNFTILLQLQPDKEKGCGQGVNCEQLGDVLPSQSLQNEVSVRADISVTGPAPQATKGQ